MDGFELNTALTVALELTGEVGALLLAKDRARSMSYQKESISSVVNEVDGEAEQIYRLRLQQAFPSHSFLGEETGLSVNDPDYCWIVDPLDGTSNYLANLPWFGTMVTLVCKGTPTIGVIALPELNLTYTCLKGAGVMLNGERVFCNNHVTLQDSLIAVGFDSDTFQNHSCLLSALQALTSQVRGIRMTNSLYDYSMCMQGSVQAVVNFSTKVWGVAAASVMLAELGFIVSSTSGDPLNFDVDHIGLNYDCPIVDGTHQAFGCVLQMVKNAG